MEGPYVRKIISLGHIFRMLIYPEAGLCNNEVPEAQVSKLCRDAASHWQRFYMNNSDKFYKDRHYFDREFPELLTGPHVLLEVVFRFYAN